MISRYVLDVLRIMGRYSRRVDKVQILCVHPVDMSTKYMHCIHSISTLYQAVIHTPFPEEHPILDCVHSVAFLNNGDGNRNKICSLYGIE